MSAPAIEEVSADQLTGTAPGAAPAESPATPPAEPPSPPEAPAASNTPPPEENPFAGETDALGREFHPLKFRLKDGKPQRDTLKRFVPVGLGRRDADAAAAPRVATEQPRSVLPAEETPAAAGTMPIDQMAAEVAINLVQTALILIGQDEGILTDFEKTTLRGPLSRILAKYNLGDKMTPELEFSAALAVIVMARLKKPRTMGWFQARLASFKNWLTRRKLAAHVSNPTPPAPEASN